MIEFGDDIEDALIRYPGAIHVEAPGVTDAGAPKPGKLYFPGDTLPPHLLTDEERAAQ